MLYVPVYPRILLRLILALIALASQCCLAYPAAPREAVWIARDSTSDSRFAVIEKASHVSPSNSLITHISCRSASACKYLKDAKRAKMIRREWLRPFLSEYLSEYPCGRQVTSLFPFRFLFLFSLFFFIFFENILSRVTLHYILKWFLWLTSSYRQ